MNLLRVCLILAALTGYELDVLVLPESEPRPGRGQEAV